MWTQNRLLMSSLTWVHTVCHRGYLNISADGKADNFCCNWPIKGYGSNQDLIQIQSGAVYRGYYMSAHVLLNWGSDKM